MVHPGYCKHPNLICQGKVDASATARARQMEKFIQRVKLTMIFSYGIICLTR